MSDGRGSSSLVMSVVFAKAKGWQLFQDNWRFLVAPDVVSDRLHDRWLPAHPVVPARELAAAVVDAVLVEVADEAPIAPRDEASIMVRPCEIEAGRVVGVRPLDVRVLALTHHPRSPAPDAVRWDEHLVDAGELSAVIDITTTEVCDLLFDGVQSAGEARLDSIARSGLPYVGSCGALDMVNFRGIESVPERFKNRNLYIHNAHVTLMRTTVDECAEMGRWIGKKLNACSGPVEFLLPLEGVSSISVEGAVFHDSEADAALFEALLETVEQTDTRKVTSVAADINDSKFISAALEAFSRVNTKQDL
jgi:hypothetical protein